MENRMEGSEQGGIKVIAMGLRDSYFLFYIEETPVLPQLVTCGSGENISFYR